MDFGVLDALSVAHLPDEHLVSAVASQLLAEGHGLPDAIEAAHVAAKLLARTEDQVSAFADLITKEIQRQMLIKFDRIRHQLWWRKQCRMGSQLDWGTRVNRLGVSVFGPPSVWKPARKVSPKVREPHYNWYRRFDGVRVAGFDAYNDDGCVTGFVYREKGAPKYALLPSKARNVQELLTYLGLHPRLLNSDVRVDWDRQSFLVGDTNRLPWIVP